MRKITGWRFDTIYNTAMGAPHPDHYHKLSDGWEPFGNPVVVPILEVGEDKGNKAVMQLFVKYED